MPSYPGAPPSLHPLPWILSGILEIFASHEVDKVQNTRERIQGSCASSQHIAHICSAAHMVTKNAF
eukprot:1158744-Pelagomonas_calceolata.AAC.8